MREKIEQYLSEPTGLRAGVDLLRAAGGPAHLFEGALRRPGVLPEDKARLLRLLGERLAKMPPAPPSAPIPTKPDDQPNAPEPASVQELRERGRMLLKRQSHLRGQLAAVETDEERYEIAKELMEEVVPRIDRVYDAIRDWQRTGEAPPPPDAHEIVQATVVKYRRRESLRSILARQRRDLAKMADGPEKQALAVTLAENESEYESLNHELGIDA